MKALKLSRLLVGFRTYECGECILRNGIAKWGHFAVVCIVSARMGHQKNVEPQI